jgi:hypothetical protein
MPRFGSWQSLIAYYEAEGFDLSEVACRKCGFVMVVAHFPCPTKSYVNLTCDQCGARLLEVQTKILTQH